jgi:hypothetical protein
VKKRRTAFLWGAGLFIAGVTAFAQSPLTQIGVKEQQARAWLLRTIGQGCPCNVYASGDPEIQAILDAWKKLPSSTRGPLTTQLYAWVKSLTATPAFRADYQKERDHYKPNPPVYDASPEQELKNKVQKESDDREQSIKFMEANGMKEQAAQMRKEWPEQLKQLTAAWRNEIAEGRKKDADDYAEGMKTWEKRTPADLNQAIASHLREFVATTADVDFAAKQGPVLGGTEYGFLNQAYWAKPWQWKFSWEWGPEAIGAARTAAQAWLKELGK